MKLFFTEMSDTQHNNFKKSCVIGFFIFLFLTGIDSLYYFQFNKTLLPTYAIFIIGLVTTFVIEFIITLRTKYKNGK